ncbi:stimulated by retinoic acid gene 8 protein homolog [Tachyglossus aculeatus]|uniref:stimulated by retinoic acid gene 8 protein homolog n=1 Tax=Tachyglossus aculeatus TaxID=9261 RepID=UPI0018F3F1B9|nr:stimulated by retinoic acid gene 8 protein homolog [Tachyglossus aculeatus]
MQSEWSPPGGERGSPGVQVGSSALPPGPEVEPRLVRRRLSQARHRATLTGLINSLRRMLYVQPNNTATKLQVLRKAKHHIQELEHTLENLLKLKDSLHLEDGNVSSLEEVKKDFVRMYSSPHHRTTPDPRGDRDPDPWHPIQGLDREIAGEDEAKPEGGEFPDSSTAQLVEFERYLYFCKHMADLLVEQGVVSLEEVNLSVVSSAISRLWQELPEEKRREVLQEYGQGQSQGPSQSSLAIGTGMPPQEPGFAEGCPPGSVVDSGAAGGSLDSTPGEIPLEGVESEAGSFPEERDPPGARDPGSGSAGRNSENPEENRQLYMQIISFLKGHFFGRSQLQQEAAGPFDYGTAKLRCLETFEDEDP